MITAWFLSVLGALVSGVSSVLPSVDFSGVEGAISNIGAAIGGYLNFLNVVLDVPIVLDCIGVMVAVEVAVLAFRMANYVFNKIPLIAGFGWGG